MHIDNRSLSFMLRNDSGTAAPRSWQAGTVLQAVVRQEGGRLLLDVGGQRLEPRLSGQDRLSLREGQQLQLRVTQSQPLMLQVLADRALPSPLNAALRQLLPQQPNLSPLVQALNMPIRPQLPQTVRNALDHFQQQLPSATQLQTSSGLAQTLSRSGLFLEAALANGQFAARHPVTAAPDVKTALLRLAAQIRTEALQRALPSASPRTAEQATPSPRPDAATASLTRTPPGYGTGPTVRTWMPLPQTTQPAQPNTLPSSTSVDDAATRRLAEIASQTERAVSRLHMLQLHAASNDSLDLLFEIPLRFGAAVELMQLRIQQQQAENEEAEAARLFRIRLAFQFRDIGPVYASLRLAGQRVGLTWWAEHTDTAYRLETQLPTLQARLEGAGFEISAVSCHTGRPAEAIDQLTPQEGGLLDEKA
ncbi:flagellar hook-length control protein FliK [Alkalilimnicola ehrlichii]|nr:flagellar hook-length control protein FliK [Alkalilimnicola ehrlichii]